MRVVCLLNASFMPRVLATACIYYSNFTPSSFLDFAS
jgi:hypothetical protein